MKPILFNTAMVRALQAGQKTVTRRVIKSQPPINFRYPQADDSDSCWWWTDKDGDDDMMRWWPSYENGLIPPYKPGDILYVRETWNFAYTLDGNEHPIEGTGRFYYAADDPFPFNFWVTPDGAYKDAMPWRPSIHMPKEAARIFLWVKAVRVERLQEITEEQARAEGPGDPYDYQAPEWYANREEFAYSSQVAAFAGLWDSLLKSADRDKYGWDANPWVWVIEFERVDKPEGWLI